MIRDFTDLIAEATRRTGVSDVATRAGMHVGQAEDYMRKALRIGSVGVLEDFDGLEGADTNWLLADAPEMYLQSVVYQVFKAAGDLENGSTAKALLDQLLDQYLHDAKVQQVQGAKIRPQEAPA